MYYTPLMHYAYTMQSVRALRPLRVLGWSGETMRYAVGMLLRENSTNKQTRVQFRIVVCVYWCEHHSQ